MTCDQFKKLHENGVAGILALTRAEQSAASKHWCECWECRDWTNSFSWEMTPQQQIEVAEAWDEYHADPETYKPDLAEIERFDMDVDTEERRDATTGRDHQRDVEGE